MRILGMDNKLLNNATSSSVMGMLPEYAEMYQRLRWRHNTTGSWNFEYVPIFVSNTVRETDPTTVFKEQPGTYGPTMYTSHQYGDTPSDRIAYYRFVAWKGSDETYSYGKPLEALGQYVGLDIDDFLFYVRTWTASANGTEEDYQDNIMEGKARVYLMTDPWDPDAITWNNKPTLGDTYWEMEFEGSEKNYGEFDDGWHLIGGNDVRIFGRMCKPRKGGDAIGDFTWPMDGDSAKLIYGIGIDGEMITGMINHAGEDATFRIYLGSNISPTVRPFWYLLANNQAIGDYYDTEADPDLTLSL